MAPGEKDPFHPILAMKSVAAIEFTARPVCRHIVRVIRRRLLKKVVKISGAWTEGKKNRSLMAGDRGQKGINMVTTSVEE